MTVNANAATLIGLFLLGITGAVAEELNHSNYRERLEYFYDSSTKPQDYRNLLLVLAEKWSVDVTTAIPAVAFLSRYLSLFPEEFSAFSGIKDKLKSKDWITIVTEAHDNIFDRLNYYIQLNREYWLVQDFDWFVWSVDADSLVLEDILDYCEEQELTSEYKYGWALDLKQRALRHNLVEKAIRSRASSFFELVHTTDSKQLDLMRSIEVKRMLDDPKKEILREVTNHELLANRLIQH